MVGIISKKIKGATLIEIVVALVIMMMVFGISLMIYMNVLQSTYSAKQMKVNFILKAITYKTIENKSYFDEKVIENGIVVLKTVKKFNDQDDLLLLHLEGSDENGKIVLSRNQLIQVEEND